MRKLDQLHEGKAKKVFATDDHSVVLISYKDDATAYNGLKRGTIPGKGAINNRMTNFFKRMLEKNGIPTDFLEEISDRETLVKKADIIPLEVIVRYVAAGSLSMRLGIPEGTPLKQAVLEFNYKNDELEDPMVNRYHIAAMGWATPPVVDQISDYALKTGAILRQCMERAGILLVDFKLEFGKLPDGRVVLVDEISPDTCRLWDASTHEKLDKDRFRRDLGDVEAAYREAFTRIVGE